MQLLNEKNKKYKKGQYVDISGTKFNRLTVLRRSNDIASRNQVCWICECSCGKWTTVDTTKLKSGHTKSCGCLNREVFIEKCVSMNNNNIKYPKMNKKQWMFYSKNINTKKSKYKITEEEIRGLMDAQLGCCPICLESLDHLGDGYHIDHDHKTGRVRGLLCFRCNAVLGKMKDNINYFKNAINYLQDTRT